MPRSVASAAALVLALPLAGTAAAAAPTEADFTAGATAGPAAVGPHDAGLSQPVEDSYYPAKGDPGVDTLHYGLDLTWKRRSRTLEGTALVRLRAVYAAPRIQLDLAQSMRVRDVRVNRRLVPFSHRDDHLVIRRAVAAGERLGVRVTYAGTPRPVRGPASRSDIARVGMRTTRSGELWTMQEPFGALTWYPVNDQPSDKALYDVRVDVPGYWVGVSNGRMTQRRRVHGRTVTRWTNLHPMSSYLVTLAVGPYQRFHQRGPRGVPITYWVPRSRAAQLVRPLRRTPGAMRWLERRLGRYPFDRIGIVVTPSDSAMETQTMITFGAANYQYGTRDVRRTVVHELAHQWYGDTVTPRDWRDVWMNEGMATYLETRWASAQGWTTWRRWQRRWRLDDQLWRDVYGPPGRYHRRDFAAVNVYYCTALMLDRLRLRIGDRAFSAAMRAWPQEHRDSNADRQGYVTWLEARTGRELSGFFRRWLNSERSPA